MRVRRKLGVFQKDYTQIPLNGQLRSVIVRVEATYPQEWTRSVILRPAGALHLPVSNLTSFLDTVLSMPPYRFEVSRSRMLNKIVYWIDKRSSEAAAGGKDGVVITITPKSFGLCPPEDQPKEIRWEMDE